MKRESDGLVKKRQLIKKGRLPSMFLNLQEGKDC